VPHDAGIQFPMEGVKRVTSFSLPSTPFVVVFAVVTLLAAVEQRVDRLEHGCTVLRRWMNNSYQSANAPPKDHIAPDLAGSGVDSRTMFNLWQPFLLSPSYALLRKWDERLFQTREHFVQPLRHTIVVLRNAAVCDHGLLGMLDMPAVYVRAPFPQLHDQPVVELTPISVL
jgi:hypothetical protein